MAKARLSSSSDQPSVICLTKHWGSYSPTRPFQQRSEVFSSRSNFSLSNMTSSNIERFDEIAAKTLARLYENFPVPTALMVGQYGVEIGDDNWDDPDALAAAEFVIASLQWLNEAGYIRFSEVRHPFGVMDAVLTARGLEVLKAIPESLTGHTLGELLVDGVKTGGKELALEAIRQVFAYSVRILTGG